MSNTNNEEIRKAVDERNWEAMRQIINRLESGLAEVKDQLGKSRTATAALETRCNMLEDGLNRCRTKLMKARL